MALCQAPRYWASTYAPLGIKCSVCLFGATEPEGSHSIKLPVSISMSFCFSRTACIAAFGTRKCEVKS